MPDIELKQNEAKTITFTVTDADGNAVDVSSATFTLKFKSNRQATGYVIEKADGDFDKTQGASGIVTVDLSTTDTNQTAGDYVGELTITISASNIDKSKDITMTILDDL